MPGPSCHSILPGRHPYHPHGTLQRIHVFMRGVYAGTATRVVRTVYADLVTDTQIRKEHQMFLTCFFVEQKPSWIVRWAVHRGRDYYWIETDLPAGVVDSGTRGWAPSSRAPTGLLRAMREYERERGGV